jgi:hypothetical protein
MWKTMLALAAFLACAGARAEEKGTPDRPKEGGPPANLVPGQAAVWGFDRDEAGQLPRGFTTPAGVWKVLADDSAPSKGNVVKLTEGGAKPDFNVLLFADTTYVDLDLRVKMKPVAGQIDQGGGLIWRAKDGRNYYVARFNPLEDNYRLYKVVDGKRTQLQSADVKAPAGWCELRVVMVGDHIWCYLNGQLWLDVRDETFKSAGLIGLWTKADAQSAFDDLTANQVKAP